MAFDAQWVQRLWFWSDDQAAHILIEPTELLMSIQVYSCRASNSEGVTIKSSLIEKLGFQLIWNDDACDWRHVMSVHFIEVVLALWENTGKTSIKTRLLEQRNHWATRFIIVKDVDLWNWVLPSILKLSNIVWADYIHGHTGLIWSIAVIINTKISKNLSSNLHWRDCVTPCPISES